ncbi:MAG: endonuclease/exonuclease/phosphatase family protein, partial [Solirubrobacterales bacterium]
TGSRGMDLRTARHVAIGALVGALAVSLWAAPAQAAKGRAKKPARANLMTRNLSIGADLTPVFLAPSFPEFVKRAGDTWNEVQRNNFYVRARSLAREIRSQNAHIVGLQEAELLRVQVPPGPGLASTVIYDFTEILLAELNRKAKTKKQCRRAAAPKGKGSASPAAKRGKQCYRGYRVAVTRDHTDFETPVNDTGVVDSTPPGFGATKDVRLTDRDAVIVKRGEVKTRKAASGAFGTLLTVPSVAGTIAVVRGWVAMDARVRGGRWFHVVNTHLEADDRFGSNPSTTGPQPNGGIRQAQAQELLAGPLRSKLPVVLVGDLNSDFPVHGDQISPQDTLGYLAVVGGGFTDRAITPPPFSCCINGQMLSNPVGPGVDHRVDHIMSNSKRIRFRRGAVTSSFADGLWSSDHFGVASSLSGLAKAGGRK